MSTQMATAAVAKALKTTHTPGRAWLVKADLDTLDALAETAVTALIAEGWTQPGTYAHLAQAIRELLDAITDMATRNTDVDAAADILRGELVDAGWDEPEEARAGRIRLADRLRPEPLGGEGRREHA